MGQGDPGGQHQAGVGQRRFHKVLFRESHFGFGVTGSGSPLSMHGFSTGSVSRPFGGGILDLFRATRRHMQCSKHHPYSITSSATASSDGGLLALENPPGVDADLAIGIHNA
jgi:hypothetical protein